MIYKYLLEYLHVI
uniref:Uncharacterized protein n=1 Tax=Arundo donax TaxID=35708 RepID=A0A0A9BVS1_ARUDO